VGVPFLADAARMEVHCLLEQLNLLQTQREGVEVRIEALMDPIPQHLTTIPGIGPVTSAAILAEIGEVTRFPTLEALVAYAGIDATVHQSGEFVATETHMSKRGSPYLRRALWQAATALLSTEGELHTYYQKKRQEGKAHGTALGALCRKLLARVYVVLKENRAYEPR
jgi:transposase